MRKRNKYILISLGVFLTLILVSFVILQIIASRTIYSKHINLDICTAEKINKDLREYATGIDKISEARLEKGACRPFFYELRQQYSQLEAKKEYVDYLYKFYFKHIDKTTLKIKKLEQCALIWCVKSQNKKLAKKLTHLKNPFWKDAQHNFLTMSPKDLANWVDNNIKQNVSKTSSIILDFWENSHLTAKNYDAIIEINTGYIIAPYPDYLKQNFFAYIIPVSKIAKYSLKKGEMLRGTKIFIKEFYEFYLKDKKDYDTLIKEYPWVKLRFNYIQKAIKKFNLKVPNKKTEIITK